MDLRFAICALRLIAFLVCCGAAVAAEPARTGSFQLTFSNRGDMSTLPRIAGRLGWPIEAMRKSRDSAEYDLKKEVFQVHVPRSYTGQQPFGLLVWISPTDSGSPWPEMLPLLEKHKLIWIGADKSGNERSSWIRISLAIEAAQQLKTRYALDESRIYVMGGSGGGRIASMLGIAFPDIFQGGIYAIGCNYFRDLPVTKDQSKVYQRRFSLPPGKLLVDAKKRSRHVLLTGEKDMNRDQTSVTAEAMKKDGFEKVTFLEVPAMAHTTPPAPWIEKALVALDKQ